MLIEVKIREILRMMPFEAMDEAFKRSLLDFSNNEPVNLFRGDIVLQCEGESIVVQEGEVRLDWLPKPRIVFEGEVPNATSDLTQKMSMKWEVFYDNSVRGTGLITSIVLDGVAFIQGIVTEEVKCAVNCAIDEVHFSLVNFPARLGDKFIQAGNRFQMGRLEAGMGQCVLIIDAVDDIDARLKSLMADGGYNLTHHCRLKFNAPVQWGEVEEYVNSIRLALRILAGQDLGFAFIECFRADVLQFKYCLHGQLTQIINCQRLLSIHVKLSGSNFFLEIFEGWVNGNADVPLLDLVHWYNMSNSNQGYAEGSLVLAQIGTELLYNWIICEHLGEVTSEEAKKLSAARKIDHLCDFSGVNLGNLELGGELKRYLECENVRSVAEATVELRNAVIHSNEVKRKKLNCYDPTIYIQARNVLIFIIERYLIGLSGYEGQFFNRMTNDFSIQKGFKIPR